MFASVVLGAVICMMISTSVASAYDLKAHSRITEYAVERSDLSAEIAAQIGITDTYVFDVWQVLECEGTYDEVAKNDRTAGGWLREGAVREDDYGLLEQGGFVRSRNHFYNPLNGQGYWFLGFSGVPAPDWALEDRHIYNDYPWRQFYSLRDAHNYFYQGLTSASPSDRESALAATFCTIGHVMHLLEDMASPQHTRNDSHATYSAYEKYTDLDRVVNSLPFDGYRVVYGHDPSDTWDDWTTFNAPRRFWYTAEPQATEPQVHDRKGLADYANRGFVTEGTNFATNPPLAPIDVLFPAPGFPDPGGADAVFWQPAIDLLPPCKWRDPEFQPHGLLAFVQTTVHDAYTNADDINPMTSTESVFDPDLDLLSQPKTFSENCYTFEAAQNLLIPRAVGYSAGLLNYFFRGAFSVHYQGQYGNGGHYVVRNDTAEAMDGTLGIYYDDAEGNREQVGADQHITLGPAGRPDSTQPFQFTAAGSDTCLNWAYQAVFRGQLGLEADAVIPARAFSPVVPGPTVEVAGDLSGGTATATLGSLTSYQWYGACYHNNGYMCPIGLADPTSGSLSGGGANLQAPLWEGWWFPCDYCCLYLRVTDSCGRGGFDGACFAIP